MSLTMGFVKVLSEPSGSVWWLEPRPTDCAFADSDIAVKS